tara:strand:- start:3808 stop:4299 length:492 start_codon:yes stop_codon:yes gene_type:complete
MPVKDKNKCGIKCSWMESNRLIINPDGQVIPCCYFANLIFVAEQFGNPTSYTLQKPFPMEYALVDFPKVAFQASGDRSNKGYKPGPHHPMVKDYIKNKEELNIFKNPLKVILNNSWFKRLYESWDDREKVDPICVKMCSVEHGIAPDIKPSAKRKHRVKLNEM